MALATWKYWKYKRWNTRKQILQRGMDEAVYWNDRCWNPSDEQLDALRKSSDAARKMFDDARKMSDAVEKMLVTA